MVRSTSMSASRLLQVGCLILAVAAGVSGQSLNKTVSLAGPKMCKFPFKYAGVYFNSCTTLGSKDDAFWCVLNDDFKPAAPNNDWANCDMKLFNPPKAMVEGVIRDCVPQLSNNVKFAGCSSDAETGSPFTCNTTLGKPGECIPSDSSLYHGTTGGKLVANVPAGDSVNGSSTGTGGGISTAAIGGICASVGAVALLAGLFVYRRRQSSKEASGAYLTGGNAKSADMSNTQGVSFAAAGVAGYRESTASSQMFSPISPGDRVYPVVSTYTPTLGDELEIQPGDKVSILIEYDDGWCQGINHSRNGNKGVFPRHCVDMSAGVPVSEQSQTPGASTTSLQ